MMRLASATRGSDPMIADVDRKKILVVDDDLPLRGMLSSVLRRSGFQVLIAGDGSEAQRVVALHQPHVILLDLMMPGMNGWEFLQALRETGYIAQSPVIVLSAHLQKDPQVLLQMGVKAILPKPFNLDELLELIRTVAP